MTPAFKELLKDVTTPTEEQVPQAPVNTAPPEPTQPPAAPAPSAAPAAPAEEAPAQEPAKAPKEPLSLEDCKDEAEACIFLFDSAQNLALSALAKRKMRNRRERVYGEDAQVKLQHLLDELELKKKGTTVQEERAYNADDVGLLKTHMELQELLTDLPFSEEEIDRLKKPLAKIIQARGGMLPPEWQLGLFTLQMIGARIAQVATL